MKREDLRVEQRYAGANGRWSYSFRYISDDELAEMGYVKVDMTDLRGLLCVCACEGGFPAEPIDEASRSPHDSDCLIHRGVLALIPVGPRDPGE